jgi:hypothetical protein
MAEKYPKNIEIAKVELPIFNILDCTCTLPERESYTRWFPLLLTNEAVAVEGE